MITIHFHDNRSKAHFIAENGFSPKEIIRETAASITIRYRADEVDFTQNGWVYQVTKEETTCNE